MSGQQIPRSIQAYERDIPAAIDAHAIDPTRFRRTGKADDILVAVVASVLAADPIDDILFERHETVQF